MAEREFLLLAATEPDRLGLMAELTGFIAKRGCNVESTRLVVLGGYAGVMVLLSGEPDDLQSVLNGLEELRARSGIRAAPRRVATRRPEAPAPSQMVFHASAVDHEGIIHALADTVRRHGANILELEGGAESAPMSGEPLFRLRMSVRLPASGGGEALWRELESIAAEQGVTLEAEPAPGSDDAPVVQGPERRGTPRGSG